jgi:hypothetical protein
LLDARPEGRAADVRRSSPPQWGLDALKYAAKLCRVPEMTQLLLVHRADPSTLSHVSGERRAMDTRGV